MGVIKDKDAHDALHHRVQDNLYEMYTAKYKTYSVFPIRFPNALIEDINKLNYPDNDIEKFLLRASEHFLFLLKEFSKYKVVLTSSKNLEKGDKDEL